MKKFLDFTKKYYQITLLILYWGLIFIHFLNIKSEDNFMFFLIFQLLIYAPITFLICFKKDAISIFIVMIYELVIIIAGVFGFIMYVNKGSEYLLDTFISLLEVVVGVGIIARCIQILRNKTYSINLIIIIGLVFLVGCRVGLLLTAIEQNQIIEYVANIVLTIMVSLYIGIFPKKEIKVFI